MSFTPLPKTFLEALRRCRSRRAVELGCADGRFSEVMADLGAAPLRVDRRSPWHGSAAELVADATALPLRDRSVALIACANLLRMIWPPARGRPVPTDWRRCLATGGKLFIFEDEPLAAPPPARHYRDLQRLLAQLDPARRRALLPRARFERTVAADSHGGGAWQLGWGTNAWPVDAERVAGWLEASIVAGHGEGSRLAAAIRKDGLSYGRYWWACWTAEGAT
jgi:hypothetical protein